MPTRSVRPDTPLDVVARRVVVIGVVVLAAANLVANLLHAMSGGSRATQYLMGWFNLNAEQSVPAWFSSLLLAAVAVAAFAVAVAERSRLGRRVATSAWSLIGAVFLWLSFDEVTGKHERVGFYLRQVMPDVEGVAVWLLVALPLAGAFALVTIPLLLRLPRAVAGRMILAGALYIAGAAGMESIGAVLIAQGHGPQSPLMVLEVLIEETLEMLATGLMLVTTLRYRASLVTEEPSSPPDLPTLDDAGGGAGGAVLKDVGRAVTTGPRREQLS